MLLMDIGMGGAKMGNNRLNNGTQKNCSNTGVTSQSAQEKSDCGHIRNSKGEVFAVSLWSEIEDLAARRLIGIQSEVQLPDSPDWIPLTSIPKFVEIIRKFDPKPQVSSDRTHKTDRCAFCGGKICIPDSDFNMISMDLKTAMCSHCIETATIGIKLGIVSKIINGKESWRTLSRKMEKAVLCCPGSVRMKRVAVHVALGLAMRAAGMMDTKNKKEDDGNSLFVIKTSDPDAFFENLETAAREAGVVAVFSQPEAYEKGFAYRQLLRLHNRDDHMTRNGAIVVNGYAKPNKNHALVVIMDHPKAINADGQEPFELT
jgi:hypothetical protein